MIDLRHPLTKGPSAKDARQPADHHSSGQAEFRFSGLSWCSSPIYGSKNNAKWSAKKKNVTDQVWETSSHFV
jgi:hypothetical protein